MVKEKGKKPHSKSKHKSIQIWKKYKESKVQGRWCPRCGSGTLLANHGNRLTCGHCHYSETNVEKK